MWIVYSTIAKDSTEFDHVDMSINKNIDKSTFKWSLNIYNCIVSYNVI